MVTFLTAKSAKGLRKGLKAYRLIMNSLRASRKALAFYYITLL